jgi:hypothetical protein
MVVMLVVLGSLLKVRMPMGLILMPRMVMAMGWLMMIVRGSGLLLLGAVVLISLVAPMAVVAMAVVLASLVVPMVVLLSLVGLKVLQSLGLLKRVGVSLL